MACCGRAAPARRPQTSGDVAARMAAAAAGDDGRVAPADAQYVIRRAGGDVREGDYFVDYASALYALQEDGDGTAVVRRHRPRPAPNVELA